jgi:hypothetical protein
MNVVVITRIQNPKYLKRTSLDVAKICVSLGAGDVISNVNELWVATVPRSLQRRSV